MIRLPHNLGHRAPFLSGVVQRSFHDRFFIVSDPDVVPDESCPSDALLHFRALFDEFPEVHKVGFGLRIDDLPDHFALRDDVVRWEEQFWIDVAKPGVFHAAIDTTFAMYRPLEGRRHDVACSLRTGPPYVARHLPWYLDSSDLDEEESYYRKHADPTVTNWNRDPAASLEAAAPGFAPVYSSRAARPSETRVTGVPSDLGARRHDTVSVPARRSSGGSARRLIAPDSVIEAYGAACPSNRGRGRRQRRQLVRG